MSGPDKTPPAPADVMAAHGVTIESAFVPFSRSRDADGERVTLNWRVSVMVKGRHALTTDYGAGVGHAPSYKVATVPAAFWPRRYRNQHGKTRAATPTEALGQWRDYLAAAEVESGYEMAPRNTWAHDNGRPDLAPRRRRIAGERNPQPVPIVPDSCDVLACLIMDSDVLNAGGFESWAGDLGFDTDSIKARATYDACLETALALRAGLGESVLAELAAAFADY